MMAVIAIAVTIPAVSAMSQKPIDTVRCMESDPYPNVTEATKAMQYFMDEYGPTMFVSDEVNFHAGIHSQNQDLPTTITLCMRESSSFNQ